MAPTGSPFAVALLAAREHDHDLVAALLSQFQPSRFDVQVFPAVESARDAIATARHDAYVADLAMVDEDADLFQALLDTGRPLIILAEPAESVRGEECVAAGAWDCLVRFTLTPPILGRSLRRGIEHARQRAAADRRRETEKMDALARLAGGMAHDFNNLLTAMLGYAEMLRESLDPGDVRRDDVIEIQRAGERASALTRQLLIFGRRGTTQSAPLDLNDAIGRMAPTLQAMLGSSCALQLTLAGDARPVRLDASRLEMLLKALVSNARDAMPNGGRIRIETRAVQLGESHAAAHVGAEPGSYVGLVVSDEGCGLTAEARAHLFEPFFTTKGKGKGTGLGLAVVHGIVHQARGHIEIDSEAGRGTTVRIYWPWA